MMIKKILSSFFAVVLAFSAHAEVEKSNPYTMIQKVADITFKRFANEQSTIRQNPNILKDIVREELLPYIDYRYAAFKVIGVNLKNTTEEERAAFVPVFRDYLVTSYAQVFTLYNNQQVEFEPAKKLGNEKIVAVNTRVLEPGRNPIDISFKVRKNHKTDEWKAFDMIAEGVSLLDSKQAELASIIRQQGIAAATTMLKEKAERDVTFKSDERSN
ncbi:phospholipid-binding protein MlaC [Colwellia sp. MEBiC06753]